MTAMVHAEAITQPIEEGPVRDDDSDPARLVPVLMERIGALRLEITTQTALIRELDSRVRTVEQERSRSIDELRDQVADLQQWRRDTETASTAAAKVKEPYARLWWLGVGAVVVMAMTGFAVVMWRIVVAGTTAGR